MRNRFLLPVLAAAALSAQPPAASFNGITADSSSRKPAIQCKQLRTFTSLDLSVISAVVVPASAAAPEHCRVSLMAQPELNMEVNLPTAWNGRLYMFGNGGWAGESFETGGRVNSRNKGLKAGFVTAATDTGHSAALEPAASFGLNRQKLLDYGFRSLHVTAETAKQFARAYYGVPPDKSYYEGCSQGGRQGLTFAQRFPNDFDGIIAGAPQLFQSGTHLARAYWMKGLNETPFPASKLEFLAGKVYDHCDAKDGLKDGLIDDPRRCDFKPARDLPKCAAGKDDGDCFTPGQITALELIYGDVMSNGKRFFPGWPVGSEIAPPNGRSGWVGEQLASANGSPGAWATYAYSLQRYLVPWVRAAGGDPDAATLFRKFDIDKDPPRLGELHELLDANDPDLTDFRKHGGKLLMYFGWADPQLNPVVGVEYYEKVADTMGPQTSDFARLFMVPGMFHCSGGIGTSQFDMTTPLVKWVEQSTPPARIEASRVTGGKVVRTRPLCSYPQTARYKGTGSIDDTANFTCAMP